MSIENTVDNVFVEAAERDRRLLSNQLVICLGGSAVSSVAGLSSAIHLLTEQYEAGAGLAAVAAGGSALCVKALWNAYTINRDGTENYVQRFSMLHTPPTHDSEQI